MWVLARSASHPNLSPAGRQAELRIDVHGALESLEMGLRLAPELDVPDLWK